MNIAGRIGPIVRAYPDAPAISVGDAPYRSYGALGQSVSSLAGGLRDRLALDAGDRVALVMANCGAYLEVLLAIWHAGLIAVPVNAKLHPREVEFILADSGARACFATGDLVEPLSPALETVASLDHLVNVDGRAHGDLFDAPPIPLSPSAPEDPAWIFYTSGTTGRPKGAVLSHQTLLGMALRYYADVDQLDVTDTIIHAAPLSHGTGLYALPHLFRGSNNVIPESRSFDPIELFGLTHRYDNITMMAAPTMLTRLAGHPRRADARLDAIRTIFYGGAPMYVEDLKRALAAFGPKLTNLYGQGESPCTITYLPKRLHIDNGHPHYEARLGSVGIARTGIDVRIVDQDDQPLPPGELGEVVTASDMLMTGYWNNPSATADALRDGWLHTGDVGVMDEDGFLTLKDRSKDLIISGGSNIYPREVEEVLLRHPAVRECSVVGRPHPDWGEEVVAFVSTHDGQSVSDGALDALCLENIARFKRPKAYVFVADLPKSSYGKILKTELRRMLDAPDGGVAGTGPGTDPA